MSKCVRVALLAMALGASGLAFAAEDATQHQIYEAAQSGHLAEAQQMIDQVLRDHPQNAKAHFVAAQLDARIGDMNAARQQLAVAKQLDPTQSFTNSDALSALTRQLAGMRAVLPGSGAQPFEPPPRRSTVPWGWIIVLALGVLVVWSLVRGRAQRAAAYGQANGYPPGTPPQPGYGPSYPPPGGSGLMGNLASGLAIGAGVAAGEELVRHVIGGDTAGAAVPPAADPNEPGQNQDMGGTDFGSQDGSSWGNDSSGDSSGDSGGGGGDWS